MSRSDRPEDKDEDYKPYTAEAQGSVQFDASNLQFVKENSEERLFENEVIEELSEHHEEERKTQTDIYRTMGDSGKNR